MGIFYRSPPLNSAFMKITICRGNGFIAKDYGTRNESRVSDVLPFLGVVASLFDSEYILGLLKDQELIGLLLSLLYDSPAMLIPAKICLINNLRFGQKAPRKKVMTAELKLTCFSSFG